MENYWFFRGASFALVLILLSPLIHATPPSEFYDLPKVTAVQNRPYFLDKDLTAQVGVMPSDAFNKGYILGTTYTHFFNDYLAWEVVNLNYSINQETGLKSDIEGLGAEVINEGFDGVLDYITYFATTSFVYTPLYNKSLLFNEHVVHGETSFVAGLGTAHFKENGLRLMVTLGFYLRFFEDRSSSWKFDFRNNIYFEETQGAVNAWSLSLGRSWQLGEPPKTPSGAKEVSSVRY